MSRLALARIFGFLVLAGAGVIAYMFAQSLSIPESKRSTVEIDVDISTLKPGAILVVDKLDVPVWILRRTPEMLASLAKTANPRFSIRASSRRVDGVKFGGKVEGF